MSSRLIGGIVHDGLVEERITSQTAEFTSHIPQGREDVVQQETLPTGRGPYHSQIDTLPVDHLVSEHVLPSVEHLVKM